MPTGLPSARVVFALALAVFATGFTLGAAAGPSASSSYAAGSGAPAQTVVVLPAPPAPAPAPPTVTQAPAAPTPPPAGVEAPLPAAPEPAAEAPAAPTPTETTPTEMTPTDTPAPAPVKHVWFVVLTGQSLQDVFGPGSHSSLLRETLPRKGVLLLQHRALPGDALANEVAMLTGSTAPGAADKALTDQLTGAGLTWKAYVEDDGDPATPDGCAPGGPRNPFGAIPSLAGTPECGSSVADVPQLAVDVASADSTPNFSFVVPNRCHDGSPAPCAPGAFADTTAADGWLRGVLRTIRASAAYKQDGLIVVTVDRGPDDTPVGALLLSHVLKGGTTVDTPTTHLTLLRAVEDLFGLPPLGGAADADADALENLWSQDLHASATTR